MANEHDGGSTSEQFELDPTQSGRLQESDIVREGGGAAATLESMGGLSDSQDEVRSLVDARDELEARLMRPVRPVAMLKAALSEDEPYNPSNVVGVGIGEKVTDGRPTGRLAVKVLVKEKKSQGDVSSGDLVPQSVGGVLTDVEESGEIRAQMFTALRRPAPCGVSIGNCLVISNGTLGCLVTRNNQLFILSNNHVMALVNQSPLGAGIPQPGRLDLGVCDRDVIAGLAQYLVIDFTPGSTNIVDAAIALTSPGLVDPRIIRPGGLLQSIAPGLAAPAVNLQVQKSGRTTQYRRGVIDMINVTIDINYAPLGGVARFVQQLRVRGEESIFSDHGDSGSLITTFPENQPVGLLFGGNTATNMTFANPIGPVLDTFGVTIVV